jgi:hypothetical protein
MQREGLLFNTIVSFILYCIYKEIEKKNYHILYHCQIIYYYFDKIFKIP